MASAEEPEPTSSSASAHKAAQGTWPRPARELSTVLASGPFEDALRTAIHDSGLSLDRIQHRLRSRGISISVATLSYWQSGRRRPERPESLEALSHIESELGLPAASLSSLLGPPKPRGRGYRPPAAPPLEQLWSRPNRLAQLLAQVDTTWDGSLHRISQQDRCEIAADGGVRNMRMQQVLKAATDGPDRWILVMDPDDPTALLPELHSLRNCRAGKTIRDTETGFLVVELVFEQSLARGETVLMEYQLGYSEPPYPQNGNACCHRFRLPVRECVVEVIFDQDRLPKLCQQVTLPLESGAVERRRNLQLGSDHSAHAVALDFGPGVFGITWEW